MAAYDLVRRYRDGDVCLCNCSECGCELLSNRHREQYELAKRLGLDMSSLPPFVAGRIKDRPYCSKCLRTSRPPRPNYSENDRRTPGQAEKLGMTKGG